MNRRDVVFVVADDGMMQMVRGFLGHPRAEQRLQCGRFSFDPAADLVKAPNTDAGVYREAPNLLNDGFRATHERAVVMLDAKFPGSPKAEQIRTDISGRLEGVWQHYAVVVIEPELEAWLWQDNPNVAEALDCPADFRSVLAQSGHWPHGQAKPDDPKAALEHLKRQHRADISNAAKRRLAERISVKHCQDAAFTQLCAQLRIWFPLEQP